MAGKKNEGIRRLLRAFLVTKEAKGLSDTVAAREAGCHRLIVTEVRRQLIAEGVLPPREDYKANGAARGGYVWGNDGRMVRADDPAAPRPPGKLNRTEAAQLRGLLQKLQD